MPGRYPPEDPREWLNRARSNLELAKNVTGSEVYLEDLCFNAQQAAEKAIKAVFVYHQISYPYVHDLAALITILLNNEINVPDIIKESAKLTRFAVATRYPYIITPVSEREYLKAMEIAEHVIRWSECEIISKNNGDVPGD
jgi:HEPN domain-containing protein